jgi:thioredoxin-dependent peroxiredoxin
MELLQKGKKAPQFSLEDKDGALHGLCKDSDYTVLFFYPKDNTPGCTIEAKEFSEALQRFARLKIKVIGISGGDAKSKTKFCDKHGLVVPMVSDEDFAVSTAYGVYGEKKFMGRVFDGIHRTTFIIGKNRTIQHVFDKVKPEGHAQEVLDVIKSLTKQSK